MFNRVHDDANVERVAERAGDYFGGTQLGAVPDSDAVRAARRAGEPLLAHAPETPAADAFRSAAERLDVRAGDEETVADRFRSAVVPDPP